jgi:hypothetical protein
MQPHCASDLFLEVFPLLPRLGKPWPCADNDHVLAGGLGLPRDPSILPSAFWSPADPNGATFSMPEINVGGFS